jgi:hypothetical protein
VCMLEWIQKGYSHFLFSLSSKRKNGEYINNENKKTLIKVILDIRRCFRKLRMESVRGELARQNMLLKKSCKFKKKISDRIQSY